MKILLLLFFPIVLMAQTLEIDYNNSKRDTTVTRIVSVNYTDTITVNFNAEEAASLYKTIGVEWRKELRELFNELVRSRLLKIKSQVLATEADEPRTGTRTAIRDARSEAIRTIQKRATVGTAAATGSKP